MRAASPKSLSDANCCMAGSSCPAASRRFAAARAAAPAISESGGSPPDGGLPMRARMRAASARSPARSITSAARTRIAQREQELGRLPGIPCLREARCRLHRETLLVGIELAHECRRHPERLHHKLSGIRVSLRPGERARRFFHGTRTEECAHRLIELAALLERARRLDGKLARVVTHASSGSSAIARLRMSG